jgi:DNA-binding CsgD family transcriptional regulator
VNVMAAAAPLCTRAIAALEAIECVACEDLSTQPLSHAQRDRRPRGRVTGGPVRRRRAWGKLQLNRHSGAEQGDRAFLRAAAPLAGEALRRAMLEQPTHTNLARGPGVIVADEAGTVISTTAEANAWLRELAAGQADGSTFIGIDPELLLTPLRALTAPGALPLRTRLRTRNRTWLVAHASSLAGSGQLAIVIEPATAAEIASIVVQAYRLTGREVQVARLVAGGLSTNESAATLFLSHHTVRDHLKAIFQKVGVSSRGEMTSKLFAEPDAGGV